eukprot:SAG22_NODE_4555_length_1236_cov_1.475814_2_plen_106_part_00
MEGGAAAANDSIAHAYLRVLRVLSSRTDRQTARKGTVLDRKPLEARQKDGALNFSTHDYLGLGGREQLEDPVVLVLPEGAVQQHQPEPRVERAGGQRRGRGRGSL